MTHSKKAHQFPSQHRPSKAMPVLKSADQFASDIQSLPKLPTTYQALNDLIREYQSIQPLDLREETMRRIEAVTGIPLICFVTKTHHAFGIPTGIDDSDLTGFGDLISGVEGDSVDVFVVSNGGSAEATQRIVHLLRSKYKQVRFIIPANAYSAATLLCFSGDSIMMGSQSTLGPIDPQLNGIPVRAILRGFEAVEQKLADVGPKALTAYMPLLQKYDLHLLEICKSVEALSLELASTWLSQYMLKLDREDVRIQELVTFFGSYDLHKTHARPIDRLKAQELGLNIIAFESIGGLYDLVMSLYNQYELMFDKMPFYKLFEDRRGIHWGRKVEEITINAPRHGPPQASDIPT